MERRAFITALAAALTVVSKQSLIYAQTSIRNPHQSLLESFINKFNFEPTESCWSDSIFTLLHKETSKCPQTIGYRSLDRRIYSLPKSGLAMVPWELNNADWGYLDSCFLFFEKLSINHWKYVKAINKYEIETILQLADVVSEELSAEQLADFLLPRYRMEHWPNSYGTRQGRVEMIVRVNSEGVQSNVCVWDEQQLLCHKMYDLAVPSSSLTIV